MLEAGKGSPLRERLLHLFVLLAMLGGSGATCPRNRQLVNDYAPTVLNPQASLEDVVRVVNANSARIQQLQSSGATLTLAGVPPLETSYALDRPRRFRLRAETRITGPELDLGSNDEIYWVWVKRNEQPAIYWGKHAEFDKSTARDIVPIPPDWLIQALGVVEIDPTARHEGPFRSRPGQLEIRSHLVMNQREVTKVMVIDDARGWVLEQHLYDANQQPIASSVASAFQFDQVHGVSLPRFVEIRLPPAGLSFSLQTDRHLVNQLSGDPNQLWTMPQITGVPTIDLASPDALGLRANNPLMARRPQRSSALDAPARDTAVRRLPPFDRVR